MVPRIAQRGHSFRGAALYYMHDKKADTSDRVAWTHVHNIPTNDPDKAFKWMAYTAMNADRLKKQAGIPLTGRKATGGTVYSFSIAWHPKQQPSKETMLESALTTLGLLKLDEHEAVMVAHNDTSHPHVHVICNLVHPENGKVAVPSHDRLIMSAWAESVERNDGEILCEQRVINNERRRKSPAQNRQFELVKHREEKLINAQRIQELYNAADSGKAFQAALMNEGYTLAKGDRRSYVLVDKAGKVYSLSRQLKGLQGSSLKERLGDLEALPNVKQLEDGIKQKRADEDWQIGRESQSDDFLRKLDALREWEAKRDFAKASQAEEQKTFYKRDELLLRIKALEEGLNQKGSFVGRLSSKRKSQLADLEDLRKTLQETDERIAEQDAALEQKLLKEKPVEEPDTKKKEDDYNRRMREYLKKRDSRDRDHDLER